MKSCRGSNRHYFCQWPCIAMHSRAHKENKVLKLSRQNFQNFILLQVYTFNVFQNIKVKVQLHDNCTINPIRAAVVDTSDHNPLLTTLSVTFNLSTSITTFTYHRLNKIDLMMYILLLLSPTIFLTRTDLLDSHHLLPFIRYSRTTHRQINNSSRTKPSPWIM